MTSTPKVSIITPMFNSEAFISDAIDSILSQTFKNWELLLIDDCSSDGTTGIVQTFIQKHANIKLIVNATHQGTAISRNKGIDAACGDYIAFLDADDLWKPNKLETQLTFMEAENCDVCYSSYEMINEQGKHLNRIVKVLPVLSYQKLLKSNYIGNLTGMYHAKRLGKILAPNLMKRQDWLLWLATVKTSGRPAIGIQESLAYYRVRDNSMSSNKVSLLKYNYWVYKKGLGFSTTKSIYCLIVFLFEHIFVKSRLIMSTKNF